MASGLARLILRPHVRSPPLLLPHVPLSASPSVRTSSICRPALLRDLDGGPYCNDFLINVIFAHAARFSNRSASALSAFGTSRARKLTLLRSRCGSYRTSVHHPPTCKRRAAFFSRVRKSCSAPNRFVAFGHPWRSDHANETSHVAG